MALKVEQMSSRKIDKNFAEKGREIPSLLVSADAHVDEPVDLWKELPEDVRAQLPKLGRPSDSRPQGGLNPKDPASWGRVARNAPCPCGSGKKYKQCHGLIP